MRSTGFTQVLRLLLMAAILVVWEWAVSFFQMSARRFTAK